MVIKVFMAGFWDMFAHGFDMGVKNKDSSKSESIKATYKFPKPPVRDGCSMCRVLVGYGSSIAH